MEEKKPPRPRNPRKPKAAPTPAQVTEPEPHQKLGDTPVAPWQMPTTEAKAAAEPVRQALNEALDQVDSAAAADRVVENLEATFGKVPANQVAPPPTAAQKQENKSVDAVAASVQAAAQAAPDGQKPERVLAETARAIEQAQGPAREAAAQAVQEVLNPEQQAASAPQGDQRSWRRELLRRAQIRRLKPLDAWDARLYLGINHLPHTSFLNGFFYFLTLIFTGGAAWYGLLAVSMLAQLRPSLKKVRGMVVAMSVATLLVELPIKGLFKRRRPFIDVVRAVVIGKKPGTWSFPSGHSAAAFAGAWVMRQFFPGASVLFYLLAAMVGFSRIYLGDHYPGDVLSGGLLGHLFAMVLGKLINLPRRPSRRSKHRRRR